MPHQRTLLLALREDLGLTGTKKSCNLGQCGACTVLMDGLPVYSCMLLALDAVGRDLTTIEGVENATEHCIPCRKASSATWAASADTARPA